VEAALVDVLLDMMTATMMESVRQTLILIATTVDHAASLVPLIDSAALDHVNATLDTWIATMMDRVRLTFSLIATTAENATFNVVLDNFVSMEAALEDVLLDTMTATMMESARQTLILIATTVDHAVSLVLPTDSAALDHANATLDMVIAMETGRVKLTF